MRNQLDRVFFLVLILTGCTHHDLPPAACGSVDPQANLPRLAEKIHELNDNELSRYNYITTAQYESQTVFIVKNCCPFCLSVFEVYDCQGNALFVLSEDTQEKMSGERLVWAAEESECNFEAAGFK